MFGTGIDERRVGLDQIRAQAERDWSQSDSAAFLWSWQSVSTFGSVACVAAEGSVRAQAGGQELSIPVRLTATLEPREGRWRIVQAHFSAPLTGEAAGESFPESGQSQ
jgi:ketosteroid isomerase-like protein